MKSEFVTIASHEFRTPIHAMLLGVSGILEGYSGEIDDETREDLQVVNEGIARLTALVEKPPRSFKNRVSKIRTQPGPCFGEAYSEKRPGGGIPVD